MDAIIQRVYRSCGIWRLTSEAEHVESIHYLDIQVSIDKDEGLFRVTPAYKPNGLKRILCSTSSHVETIHRAWPLMMLRHVKFKCLNNVVGDHHEVLLIRFAEAGMSEGLLCWLRESINTRARKLLSRERDKGISAWCTLPFHPLWQKALKSAMKKFNKSHRHFLAMAHASWGHLEVRSSWTNFLPNVASLIHRCTARLEVGE